jgi:Holliday junction resolvase RusA-like endonuclease
MERFDFVVRGTPRSRQRGRKAVGEEWKETVRAAAHRLWPANRPPYAAELQALIVYYYWKETTIDIDNISKLILDAIKGLLIDDDQLVSQLIVRKTDLTAISSVRDPSEVLAPFLGIEENFVYVCLGPPPNHREIPI